MITDAILAVIFAPLTWLLGLLPSVTLPSWATPSGAVLGWAHTVGQQMGLMNQWLPISELLGVLPIVLLLAGGVLLFKVTQFVISLFTGGGGAT